MPHWDVPLNGQAQEALYTNVTQTSRLSASCRYLLFSEKEAVTRPGFATGVEIADKDDSYVSGFGN